MSTSEYVDHAKEEYYNSVFVTKKISDAKREGGAWTSKSVTPSNAKGFEYGLLKSSLSQSIMTVRPYTTVKRPGKKPIKVYSPSEFKLTADVAVKLLAEIKPEKALKIMEKQLRCQLGWIAAMSI